MRSFIVAILLSLLLTPAHVTSGDIVNHRVARRLAPRVVQLDMPVSRCSVPIATMYMEISCYSPTVAECDSNPLITASGQKVRVGGIAADLSVFPFGTILLIDGYNNGNTCTVIDTGGAIQGNKLDVFMWSTHEAVHFGRRRNVRVTVLYVPKARK